MGILIPLFLVIICCIIIWRASDGFTAASDYIGRNLSEGVRGATINAIGSSLPELFTSFFFLFYLKDSDGFSGGIGTTAGSAIFNGMIIPAFVILVVILTGIAKNITVSRKVLFRDGFSLILAEFLFIIIISGTSLHWWHGMFLMIIYFIYLFYMFKTMKAPGFKHHLRTVPEFRVHESRKSIWHYLITLDFEPIFIKKSNITSKTAWPLLIFSTFSIAATCLILVQACEWIGSAEYTIPYIGTFEGLDIPIMFVAVILASAASSVPDTIISMNDAKKGNYDDAISNALGSNIFDICFALGFPLFLYTIIYGPIIMHQEVIEQSSELRMLLLILTVLAFGVYNFRKIIDGVQAYMLLGIYSIFTLYVIGRGAGHPITDEIAEVLRNMVSYLNLF
ncbi:MAG: sodium:calcium antiporter [Cyclobacteriaceae bacterium]|nr:sodium:calcium antiporter [Cyclobacteriaceae bacterium]